MKTIRHCERTTIDAPPEPVLVACGMITAALSAHSLADIEWQGAFGGYLDGRVSILVETGYVPSAGAIHQAIADVLTAYTGDRIADDIPILGRALATRLGWLPPPSVTPAATAWQTPEH